MKKSERGLAAGCVRLPKMPEVFANATNLWPTAGFRAMSAIDVKLSSRPPLARRGMGWHRPRSRQRTTANLTILQSLALSICFNQPKALSLVLLARSSGSLVFFFPEVVKRFAFKLRSGLFIGCNQAARSSAAFAWAATAASFALGCSWNA